MIRTLVISAGLRVAGQNFMPFRGHDHGTCPSTIALRWSPSPGRGGFGVALAMMEMGQ